MSHVVGTIQTVSPSISVGPDSGSPPTSANTWEFRLAHTPAPLGTRLLMLHFHGASLPANNRLEVDLGYDTDVFTSANGSDFWTRPVNPFAFADGKVPIRYVTNGAGNGGVTLFEYGRGEPHSGDLHPTSTSNCDPFLLAATYAEPNYDPNWFCHTPPNWQNAACATGADVRARVAKSVGMVIHADLGEYTLSGLPVLSTCTVTVIGPDTVLYAGHCASSSDMVEESASVIFNYATDCAGKRPAGYSGHFFKVIKVTKLHYTPMGVPPYDYCILQLRVPAGGLGLPAIPVRSTLPAAGEQVFGIHHPNGAVKKLSQPLPGFATVLSSTANAITVSLDVSGGSSGSGLFDTSGNITGVLSAGSACGLNYFPTATILPDITATPVVSPPQDVMLVFDRSGSMSNTTSTGRTKIEDARDAASLFTQLIRSGSGNRLGLVSFSTSASSPVDFALSDVNTGNKNTLTGGSPFTGGLIGGLTPGGNTSIGDGLSKAAGHLPADPGHVRSILLFTDGLQNTPPLIADVDASLSGVVVNAIGLGTEANLDGSLLTSLCENHQGLYTRAGDGLALKKYFALAFGNIFEAGALLDPEFFLPAGVSAAPPLPFTVCGEETVTVVVAWDRADSTLIFDVRTPGGTPISAGSPGTESALGKTWSFLRVPLPIGGERDGSWKVEVAHGRGTGEFSPPPVDTRYIVNVVVSGGPILQRKRRSRPTYTGDAINPLISVTYPIGGFPDSVEVSLEVTRPNVSVGNVLSQHRLGAAGSDDGDQVPPRQATLTQLEATTGAPVAQYITERFSLSDRADDGGTGMFEGGSVFGLPMADLFQVEGNYTFHATATYGIGCTTTRELFWTLHASVGINPGKSTTTVTVTGNGPGGTKTVTIVITPRDVYGNLAGPGQAANLPVTGEPGTTVSGPILDNGDGTYTITGTWDAGSGSAPGVVIHQPGRPPSSLVDPSIPTKDGNGSLIITFVDTAGHPVNDLADVFLRHIVLSDRREARRWPTINPLIVRDLISTHSGIYEVQALPDHHEAVGRFVTIDDGKVTRITFVLRPK